MWGAALRDGCDVAAGVLPRIEERAAVGSGIRIRPRGVLRCAMVATSSHGCVRKIEETDAVGGGHSDAPTWGAALRNGCEAVLPPAMLRMRPRQAASANWSWI